MRRCTAERGVGIMANDVGGQHVSLWDDRRLDLQRLRKQGHDPCKKRVRESSWTLGGGQLETRLILFSWDP